MKKLLYVLFLFIIAGCTSPKDNQTTEEVQENSSVIDFMCKDAADDVLTPEEIEWWDNMNAEGGTLIVRGAERNLDTIVNHMHFKFITDP